MSTEELLVEIKRLSLDERLEILEMLSRDVREALRPTQSSNVPVERVRGLLKTNTLLPENDDLKRDYGDFIETKYS